MTSSDLDLLQQFARQNSETAFATLVQRHLHLVYSAALRQVRSPQLAEDVAQSVFTDLARAAAKLKPETILTAWLYQVTRRTAIDVVRREARRQLREQIATEMNATNTTTADWTHIEPLLDEAMHALDETDRAAVLLRYFENKSLREVGQTLGTSDDTAQKRVSRAVERLREFFAKRGVTVGASGLVVVISANAVQAAPVGLALTISTAAALSGTTLVTTSTLIAATTKTIAMTTLQKAALVGGLICAAVLTSYLVSHRHSNPPTPPTNNYPVAKTPPPTLPEKSPALFWRRANALRSASTLVTEAGDEMRDTLARLKDALYATKSSGRRSDDPASKLLYSIPLENRAAALEMVMVALRDQNQTVCRRAISLIPLIWPQGEAALPALYDLIRTKSQEWPGLAGDAFIAAVQVRSETDVIPELVLAAMQGGHVSQREFALQLPIIMAQVEGSSSVFASSLQPYLNSLDANVRLTAAQLLAQLPGTPDKSIVGELAASLMGNGNSRLPDDQLRASLTALMKMGASAQEAIPSLVALGNTRPDLEDSVMMVLKAIAPDELKGVGVATPLPRHDEQSQTVGQSLANGTLTIQGAIEALKDPLLMLPTARGLADYGPKAAAALPALLDALVASYIENPNSAIVLASVIERLDPEQPKPLLMAWDVLPALNKVSAEATKDNIAGLDNTMAILGGKLPLSLLFKHDDIRKIYVGLNQLDPRLSAAFQAEIINADSKFAVIFQNTNR